MSRKTLITCLAVLFAMLAAVGVAIAFLYSGTEDVREREKMSFKGSEEVLAAIPSDAVLVGCSSRADNAFGGLLSSFAFADSLCADMQRGLLASLKKSPMAFSLHYSGKLIPLYVFDMDDVSENASAYLADRVAGLGCSSHRNGRYLIVSESDALVKSSSRHLDTRVSIADSPGFIDALESVEGDVLVFAPNLHLRKLLSQACGKTITRHASFLERTADWCAFAFDHGQDKPFSFDGVLIHDSEPDEFLTVLENGNPSVSHVSDVLPSYTLTAVALPLSEPQEYISRYKSFIDSRQSLQDLAMKQKALESSSGVAPEELFLEIGVKEIANASFKVDGKVEKVNLIHTDGRNIEAIFKGNGITSLRGYVPAVHKWAYGGFAASVFGRLFSLDDESCFTYIDGWVVSGSEAAVNEYAGRNALDYSLTDYMSDAGRQDLLSGEPVLALVYCSLTEDEDLVKSSLKKSALAKLAGAMNAEYAPAVITVGKDKDGMTLDMQVRSLTLKKTKAPVFERDTTVVVPEGPFKVKNSHTGKVNTFYQNSQKAICLRDENGKDLWGVPFGKSLCGTAHNVDYYANGKLQIIFGAGQEIYVIDRLGRYVSGFPLNLGKEILLGPDVYDFSGARKYNIMVLHKDNTIEMYNLKGKKPDSWRSIAPEETIKSLPEKLIAGGKNFWVVRTSMQTVIYPFYGGEPLTVFEGDEKIRPDSEVKVLDNTSVQVNCYDGKSRTVKIR